MIADDNSKALFCELKNESSNGVSPERTQLSSREQEVLKLAAEGKSNKQIADMLNISFNTIDYHNRHIVAVLGAVNMKNAIAIAFRQNILK